MATNYETQPVLEEKKNLSSTTQLALKQLISSTLGATQVTQDTTTGTVQPNDINGSGTNLVNTLGGRIRATSLKNLVQNQS